MTIETTITPAMERDILTLLRDYRKSQPRVPLSFGALCDYEKEIAATAMRDLLLILQRGQAPTLDCDVLDAMARLQVKALPGGEG